MATGQASAPSAAARNVPMTMLAIANGKVLGRMASIQTKALLVGWGKSLMDERLYRRNME
jgi:hypothetical protein